MFPPILHFRASTNKSDCNVGLRRAVLCVRRGTRKRSRVIGYLASDTLGYIEEQEVPWVGWTSGRRRRGDGEIGTVSKRLGASYTDLPPQ